jgi:hypothetical protein
MSEARTKAALVMEHAPTPWGKRDWKALETKSDEPDLEELVVRAVRDQLAAP